MRARQDVPSQPTSLMKECFSGLILGPQYQIITPAYYDQNGQLVMGNPRGLAGASMRLVPPAPVLVSAGNQQGEFYDTD